MVPVVDLNAYKETFCGHCNAGDRGMCLRNRDIHTGPGWISYFIKKMKNVSCEYRYDRLIEWLKLNFASCMVHQTRSWDFLFEKGVCSTLSSTYICGVYIYVTAPEFLNFPEISG